MKTKFILLFSVLAPAAFAQQRPNGAGGVPGSGSNAPSGNAAPAGASSGGSTNSSASSNTVNAGPNLDTTSDKASDAYNRSVLNTDDLSGDTENGIFTWHGSKFDIGNNLIVAQRFQRYLSSPGFADTNQDYQNILKQIQDLLSTNTSASADNGSPAAVAQADDRVSQAWELLYKAAQFPEDAGASETLANQVYDAWRVRDELAKNADQYKTLDKQRQQGEFTMATDGAEAASNAVEFAKDNPGLANPTAGKNAGISSNGTPNVSSSSNRNTNNQSSNSTASNGGGTGSNNGGAGSAGGGVGPSGPSLSAGVGNISLGGGGSSSSSSSSQPTMNSASLAAMHSADLARTYAKQALLDADATTMGLQVKLQYQAQFFAFIVQRRFEHSLIAGLFYEHIFKGSQQRMNIGQDQMSKFLNTDDVVPSANSFEAISHEAIAEADSGMRAVNTAYDSGDRWTALQQLQQTFLIGENLPVVQDFDAGKRRVLLGLYRESTDLKHAIDMRDFGSADADLQKIQADAPDFQAGPVHSVIQEGEQTSNLALMSAQQAIMTGDTDRFTANMQKATEIWPLNPDLKKFSKNMLDKGDLANVGTAKFDDLLAHGDDRSIFENRNELGLAVYQDPGRAAKLNEILDRMGKVEMMIAYSDQAVKQNNNYAAWEALASAADLEPNDPELARKKAEVVPQAATFVAALDSAGKAEKSGDYASSLNYYLQAQDIYPPSQICHEAIDRVSTRLMATLNPSGPAAQSLKQPVGNPPAAASATPVSTLATPATTPTAAAGAGSSAGGSKSLF